MEKTELVMQRIDKMNRDITLLKEKFEDHFLSDEEKIIIDEAMKEKKEGRLVLESEIF